MLTVGSGHSHRSRPSGSVLLPAQERITLPRLLKLGMAIHLSVTLPNAAILAIAVRRNYPIPLNSQNDHGSLQYLPFDVNMQHTATRVQCGVALQRGGALVLRLPERLSAGGHFQPQSNLSPGT